MFENSEKWEGICVLKGSFGTCFKCKRSFELNTQDIANKKFICTECKAYNKIIIVDETLVGIKGWLLIFAIWLVLSLVSTFASLSDTYEFQINMEKNSITIPSGLIYIIYIMKLIILIYLSYLHYLFFSKNMRFRKEFNKFMLAFVLSVFISNCLLYEIVRQENISMHNTINSSSYIFSTTLVNIVCIIIFWIVWSSYFRKSKRFENTFLQN